MTLHAVPVPDQARTHPLAHRGGLALLGQCIQAHQIWSGLTPAQRSLLRRPRVCWPGR